MRSNHLHSELQSYQHNLLSDTSTEWIDRCSSQLMYYACLDAHREQFSFNRTRATEEFLLPWNVREERFLPKLQESLPHFPLFPPSRSLLQ